MELGRAAATLNQQISQWSASAEVPDFVMKLGALRRARGQSQGDAKSQRPGFERCP
jgi:hypothetical protein